MSILPTQLSVISLAVLSLAAGCRSELDDRRAPSSLPPESTPAGRSGLAGPQAVLGSEHVTSKDGTQIAYSKSGAGPALVIVSGALSSRELMTDASLVEELGRHFTVYTYDRRGRGESTDTKPYTVEREIEDLDAVIANAGDRAFVFGVSSGAALSLHAAAALGAKRIPKLALYEPPYGQPADAYGMQKRKVGELVALGKPGHAAEYFMGAIGLPPEAVEKTKRSPQWPAIAKLDHTLAYDFEILGNGEVPEATARSIVVPTMIVVGDKSMPFMAPTAEHLASLIPHAQRTTLAGQTHQVKGDVVAPVLSEFFSFASS